MFETAQQVAARENWLARIQADLLAADDPPAAVTWTPVDPPAVPFQVACLPEHRRRVLAIAAAVTGAVPELGALMDATFVAFSEGRVLDWLEGLGEMEKRAGVGNGD